MTKKYPNNILKIVTLPVNTVIVHYWIYLKSIGQTNNKSIFNYGTQIKPETDEARVKRLGDRCLTIRWKITWTTS